MGSWKMNSFNAAWILFILSASTFGGNSKKYLVKTEQKDTDDQDCTKVPYLLAPVCGTNGKTYDNKWLAECDKVATKCEGKCPCEKNESCIVPDILWPVCGSDGKTYSNEWDAKCEKVDIKCEGKCPCANDQDCTKAPDLLDPVCGTNFKTYDNKWIAECDKVAIKCEGKCPCKSTYCKDIYDCLPSPSVACIKGHCVDRGFPFLSREEKRIVSQRFERKFGRKPFL